MNMGTTKPKGVGIAAALLIAISLIGAVFTSAVSGDCPKSRSQTISDRTKNDVTELARDDLHGMYRRYAIG